MKVKCIKRNGCCKGLTLGKAYKVSLNDDDYYWIRNDFNKVIPYLKNKFMEVEEG